MIPHDDEREKKEPGSIGLAFLASYISRPHVNDLGR